MEDYETKVANLLANQSQIISKFTSKTNQIRFMGGHGGALPPTRASRGCILAPPQIRGAMGLGSGNTLGRGSYDLQLSGSLERLHVLLENFMRL